jgi:hypothetical protein
MDIRLAIPDGILDASTIDAALEATTRANEALGHRGMLPDIGAALGNGLKWRPEPWIGERFDLAPTAAARGWGDCDDLAPWLAAQLRVSGEDARAFARPSGRNRWHVQVERGDGQILDPSAWAGMPTKNNKIAGRPFGRGQRSVCGSGESAIVALPWRDKRWYTRADFPISDRIHVTGLSRNRDLHQALAHSLGTYAAVAEGCHGIGDAYVGDLLGDIVSVGLPLAGAAFGIPPQVTSALMPMAGGILNAAGGALGGGHGPPPPPPPGAQQPMGSPQAQAQPMGGPVPQGWPSGAQTYAIPGPGGHGEGRVTCCPGGGPVIVRF